MFYPFYVTSLRGRLLQLQECACAYGQAEEFRLTMPSLASEAEIQLHITSLNGRHRRVGMDMFFLSIAASHWCEARNQTHVHENGMEFLLMHSLPAADT